MLPHPHATNPGQESVWDYPRPPRVEAEPRPIEIILGGELIASTSRAWRVLETSHPPVYYIPRQDVIPGALELVPGASSFCEWKGRAVYYDVLGGGERRPRAAWSYPDPTELAGKLEGALAFYAGHMDHCTVGGEVVTPQPGGFYGGWITSWVSGPFKGEPGSWGW